jgi:hypothetical protein
MDTNPNPEKEKDAYSPNALDHPMDEYTVKANGLPAVRKEVEPDAWFDRQGHMVIHTPNQANIFETEKTKEKNVHRSPWFDEEPNPAAPYDPAHN